MTASNILHWLCILGVAICVITLFIYLLSKKYNVFQKINTSIHLIVLGAFIYISEYLLNFTQTYYSSSYTYNFIFLIVITVVSLIGVVLTLISFAKKSKINEQTYRIYEIVVFVLSGVLVWNLFTANKSCVYLLPILIINFILSEAYLINATEKLNTTGSKALYFITNSIFSLFWICALIMLVNKQVFSINIQFILILVLIIALCFSSIIFGILRCKKEKTND